MPPPVTMPIGEVAGAQLVEQLQHRRVDDPVERRAQGAVPVAAEEVVDRGVELVRGLTVEQRGERAGDLRQADLADRGHVAAEHGSELGALGQRRVGGDALLQRVDEEVELHVGRLLAPHRAVVVDVGDTFVGGHVGGAVEEVEDPVSASRRAARRAVVIRS